MDLGAVADGIRSQQTSFLTPEALQAALAVLAPGGVPIPSLQLTNNAVAQAAQPAQTSAPQSESSRPHKQQAKRKATRTGTEDVSSAGPRPPPIKHEVYEDLEEKFEQLQSEREPKRHRGNPKGYQIKSFCKNPACGKQLNGGRTNRCEHCGFDLASHRRNSQLERLIKTGPLAHTQARSLLRDAANEVHVRTGGKAMVLTLVYIEGAASAPAQAIAYGKPAAAFVEARKELIICFEEACRAHFKEQQQPAPQQQEQQPQQHHQPATLAPNLMLPSAVAPGAATAAAMASALASTVLRAGSLGPGGHFLSPAGAPGPVAPQPAPDTAIHGGVPGHTPTAAAAPPAQAVDLDAVIAATVADPPTAIARCREARLSGDVLVRLPQAMQLTVLMQAGLLAGEAASVVVELESRLRPPPPLQQQVPHQPQQPQQQQQHHQQQAPSFQLPFFLHQHPFPPPPPAVAAAPAVQQHSQSPPAGVVPFPPGGGSAAQQHQQLSLQAQHGAQQQPLQPPPQHGLAMVPAGSVPSSTGDNIAALAATAQAGPGPSSGAPSGPPPTGPASQAAVLHSTAGMPLFAPLHAALMAAAAAGAGAEALALPSLMPAAGTVSAGGQLQSLLMAATPAPSAQPTGGSVPGLEGFGTDSTGQQRPPGAHPPA